VGLDLLYEVPWSHPDTPQSVGLLWTSDQPVAETSTSQHTTLTRERQPCLRPDSNPQSQQASRRKPTSEAERQLGSNAAACSFVKKIRLYVSLTNENGTKEQRHVNKWVTINIVCVLWTKSINGQAMSLRLSACSTLKLLKKYQSHVITGEEFTVKFEGKIVCVLLLQCGFSFKNLKIK
jgi:hypothetical protein